MTDSTQPRSNPPLLELLGITKRFGAVRALRGVDFNLQCGEVHALLGENGAGKSTLIKVVTGAHQPDEGTIAVAGEQVVHLTPTAAHRLGISCIYQQPALFPDLTVEENIALRLEPAGALRRVDWASRRKRAARLLKRIKAEIDPAVEVRELSMPCQQLVEIACAVGAGARIVVMDEPTASLTLNEQYLLFAIVRDLRNSGVGVVYISHRLEEIFELADRVTVLRDGESVGTCRVEEVSESGLIQMVVGREVSNIYPPSESKPGKVVLALRNVGCKASGVHGVSLEIHAGEVFGLAGLVGAGRTELARVIFGLTPADAGEIVLGGTAFLPNSPREAVASGIAYVPEDRRKHGIVLDLPIAQNTTMAIHRRIFPWTWLRFGAEHSLTLKYICDLGVKCAGPEAPGGSLSGGNQQKVSLSRWLATDPKLLILDEPTQGVDIGAKSEIHRIIRRLAKQGLAVLMISSDLPEILGMSDRIGVMRSGTLNTILPSDADPHTIMTAALGQTKTESVE